jgi:hypothetical protein
VTIFGGVLDIKAHWESKHSKMPFDLAKYEAAFGANKVATKAETRNILSATSSPCDFNLAS